MKVLNLRMNEKKYVKTKKNKKTISVLYQIKNKKIKKRPLLYSTMVDLGRKTILN